ncbi:MAG: YqjD family protein [Burkholderiales bacterium]
MSETTHTKRDQLAADFQRVMDDINALIDSGGTKVDSEVKAIRERLRERLDDTRRRIGDLQYEGVERARRAARHTDEYVHDHPWHAVGAAAALGLVVGVLIARH